MNERIKNLIEQSNKSAHFLVTDEDKAKFAELIVRECIDQVITGPNGPAHYAVEAALRLKKHFGIE